MKYYMPLTGECFDDYKRDPLFAKSWELAVGYVAPIVSSLGRIPENESIPAQQKVLTDWQKWFYEQLTKESV